MVDACMRQLPATGWLNFRMRAMLVSFAAYHLWLHWRAPGLFLARQFLDFEPGIHWSQMPMQSGTTGINTLRIYSPAKQARDQDPQGLYTRQWVPEFGSAAHPRPIVDERNAVAASKERLHGSRKSGLPATAARPRRGQAVPDGQGRLFWADALRTTRGTYTPSICPPSTAITCPVTQRAWSEARNSATSAISSGVPMRPKGMRLRVRSYKASPAFLRWSQTPPGNSIDPGAMQFTRTPRVASIAAWLRV